MVWEKFLKPVTQLCAMRPLTNVEKAVYRYMWSNSQGPNLSMIPGAHNGHIARMIDSARATYSDDMDEVVKATSKTFENEARPFYQQLLADEHGASLALLPEKALHGLMPAEMTHARFLLKPEWAQKKDLMVAISELVQVGVIRSVAELGELMQQGRHARLFGAESKSTIFANPKSIEFWVGIVTLWMIGVHEGLEETFEEKMGSFAQGEEFHPAPGLKKFSRIIVKSFEYIDEYELDGFEAQVLAPLYVIDVLRCTFVVPTAKRLLELRESIVEDLPNTRTKNGYSANAEAPAGYRDMKLNVVFKGVDVAIITEIQLILTANAELKKKGHAVYNVARGDFSNGSGDSLRKPLASYMLPSLRTLRQTAAREMNTGAMTVALALR